MAVEARRLSLFPFQMLDNSRQFAVDGNGNVLGAPMSSAADTMTQIYNSAFATGFHLKTPPIKSDSGLTYTPISVPRDQQRESSNSLHSVQILNPIEVNRSSGGGGRSFTFLGEDISNQIHSQMLEIDQFIAQHNEKIRTEIDDRQKRYSRRIAAAVQQDAMKKLKAKEDEIQKIGKLNWELEEHVKSLAAENQLWRDLAQSKEAAANELRCNLEQIIAQVEDEKQRQRHGRDTAVAEDEKSCCGSNVAVDEVSGRICRRCQREESCVLLLPCRHLCVCAVCVSAVNICPLCRTPKTATFHVNLSF